MLGTPVVSDTPALILAGEYDPLTAPLYGTIAGRTLRNSHVFEFPAIGHDAQRGSPCAHAMMMDFLANPTVAPSAACIADMQPPAWVIPGGR
jgi:pimeloyl-ACP methyl ester carboxylesterase